jgi:transposase
MTLEQNLTETESYLAKVNAEEKEDTNRLRELQQQVREVYTKLEQRKTVKKSLAALQQSEQQHTPVVEEKRRKYQAISPQIKALITQKVFYDGTMTWDEAIKNYGVSRASISRILKQEKRKREGDDEDDNARPKKRGRRPSLSVETLAFILSELERDSQLTLQSIVASVEKKFKIETSASSIDRALTKMNITWKNVLPIPVDWNTDNVIERRISFVSAISNCFPRATIYIDETGFCMHTKKSKGRAVKGEPAKLTLVPKGRRISLIASLSNTGIVHYQIVQSLGEKKRGTGADDFRNFLIDLFPKIPRDSVIILDNAKIHHAEKLESTWDMAKATYGIDKLFLPPYSPFLNPIEYAFNTIKSNIQEVHWETREQLVQAIKDKIPVITSDKAYGFMQQSAKYYTQCRLGLPFRGKPLNPEGYNNNNSSSYSTQPSVPVITEV